MKRSIDHLELARDSRFIRQDNISADLMAKLPDDVDAVVELFEKISPIIETGARGTAAEPLFDRFGPAFLLMTLNEPLRPNQPGTEDRLAMRMHGIFVGELQALEGAGRSLWDFPDSPWEFKLNMARQCWDEARHVQIFEKLLEHVGGEVGMHAESTFLFEAACADDPALREALIRTLSFRPFRLSQFVDQQELLAEAGKLRQDGLTDEELRRAKAKVIGQKKIGRQDLGGLAIATGLDELYGLGFAASEEEDEKIDAVTPREVQQAAQKYLRPGHCVMAVAHP